MHVQTFSATLLVIVKGNLSYGNSSVSTKPGDCCNSAVIRNMGCGFKSWFCHSSKYICTFIHLYWASLVAQIAKNHSCNAGDLGVSPGSRRSPGEGNGYPLQYSCPWTELPGELQSMRSQWVRHDWVINTFTLIMYKYTNIHTDFFQPSTISLVLLCPYHTHSSCS